MFLFCLSLTCSALAEEHINEIKADTPVKSTEKIVLEESEPYNRRISNEAPSFFSKLKSWIFPFGGADNSVKHVDSVPAAVRHAFPIYAPPSSQSHKPNCNPCSQEPWIPVATNYGQNTILGFVQPSNIGSTYPAIEHLQPPPSGQYGAPNFNTNYGPPKDGQYALPNINTNYGPPREQYFASNELSANYGPPSASNQINQNLGPPPEIHPTPHETYGPPLSRIPVQNLIAPVNIQYGPPKISDGIRPHLNYGVPLNTNYGPPPNKVLLPNHGPPPTANHISQRPGKSYGPPPRRPNSHGPLNYPPIPKDYMSAPPFLRNQPKQLQGPPRFVQKPNGKARPPQTEYGPPFFIPDMKPPLVNGFVTNYGIPVNQFSTVPTAHYGQPDNIHNNAIPSVVPSDSYGAPVTGNDRSPMS